MEEFWGEQPQERQFLTKNGVCILHDRAIELRSTNARGHAARGLFGSNISSRRTVYLVLGIALILAGLSFPVVSGDYFMLTFVPLGAWLIYSMSHDRDASGTAVIERHQIEEVTFHPAAVNVSRPYFIVRFRDYSGKMLKRYIILRGAMQLGFDGGAWAVMVMTKEGLLGPGKQ
jgi:hypothetical protein